MSGPHGRFRVQHYEPGCALILGCRTRLFFIQEKRPGIPAYIMLDSIADTFSCISPQPVWHKDDPQMQNKVRRRRPRWRQGWGTGR